MSNYHQISEQVISSRVISNDQTPYYPEETVRIVEVPQIEERIIEVPRKEIREIETRVPKYEYETVERIVEIPQVITEQRMVEVEQEQEVIRYVPVKKIVEIPKEVIKYVPKVEVRTTEKIVEVAGEIIQKPVYYPVEQEVIIPRFIDVEVPTVVAQKVQPVVTESSVEHVEIELRDYEPYLVPVDVYIPRPITRTLIPSGKSATHQAVAVPAAQYNALLKSLNPHTPSENAEQLYRKQGDGSIPMLHGPGCNIVPPVSSDWQTSLPQL